MKKIMSVMTLISAILAHNGHASEADALNQTAIDLQRVSVSQNFLPNIKNFNEQTTLVKRAEYLSTTLFGKAGKLLDGLPEDPYKRISILIKRVNSAKEVWVKKLELKEAEDKLHETAKSTGAEDGFGEVSFLKA